MNNEEYKSSDGNNRGTRIKGVMVRKEKKTHSQLEWPPNINPLLTLSRSICWQPAIRSLHCPIYVSASPHLAQTDPASWHETG